MTKSPYLTISFVAAVQNRVTIEVSGELDGVSGQCVAERLPQLSTRQTTHVVLSLAEVSFCDIAGARALVIAYRRITAGGVTCTILGLQSHVRWLLDTIGVSNALGLTPARDPAGPV
jgi:anti-anti-sigma factor